MNLFLDCLPFPLFKEMDCSNWKCLQYLRNIVVSEATINVHASNAIFVQETVMDGTLRQYLLQDLPIVSFNRTKNSAFPLSFCHFKMPAGKKAHRFENSHKKGPQGFSLIVEFVWERGSLYILIERICMAAQLKEYNSEGLTRKQPR